jgi:oligopeptide/dipeptide ABC transporter ATP-binding protein
MPALLEIQDLSIQFATQRGTVHAVNGVNLTIGQGETLSLVGESGCGKSVTAMSILRLLKSPPARITGGRVLYRGTDILTMTPDSLRKLRGNEISMIFQEPMTSLNPVLTVGRQIAETVMLHRKTDARSAMRRALEMLEAVRIPDARRRIDQYPHELSGGMRQRVMIAMALACEPRLLIADEPTTALDVTVQAQIMDLLLKLKEETGAAILLITHDMGVVAEAAERVAVMYAGSIVEEAPVDRLFAAPQHQYTRGLLVSIPRIRTAAERAVAPRRMPEITGSVPSLLRPPRECQFAPRCGAADARCRTERPRLHEDAASHRFACWHDRRAPG